MFWEGKSPVLVVDLGLTIVYFSYLSVKRPGSLTASGTASVVLFIRPYSKMFVVTAIFLTE